MKKSTKKSLAALVIILLFGMSTIAYVTSSIFGTAQEEFKPLEGYVIEGEISSIYEKNYVNNGYTWVKFYYNQSTPLNSFLDSLPDTYTTNTDQKQLFIQKINSNYNDMQSYMIISSLQGAEEIENPDEIKISEVLCRVLTSVPPECGFIIGNITIG